MVVVRAAPFTCTIEPLTNPVPLTVSVNPGLPAVTLDGLIEVMVGAPCARAAVPEITGNKISTGSERTKATGNRLRIRSNPRARSVRTRLPFVKPASHSEGKP